MAARVDYRDQDDGFAREKDGYEKRRNDLAELKEPTSDVARLGLIWYGLKAFYNVFRNLENIAGEEKVSLLDRILDFHIQLNLEFITFFGSRIEDADFQTLLAYLFTLGCQHLLSCNIGNQSLKLTIEQALKLCGENDFKELLLRILYTDLRLAGHEKSLAKFAERTKSRAAVEIVYLKLRSLMIKHDSKVIPLELIVAFRSVYEKRLDLNDKPSSHGAVVKIIEAQVQRIKREHVVEIAKSAQDT